MYLPEKITINKYFMNFVELHNTIGSNMTDVFIETLKKCCILLDDIRWQEYDNSFNICSQHNSIQTKIR